MGDEEIIKRRLLIDGDGTGDDRRLNLLLKNFIKWCNASDPAPDPQEQMFFDRLMAQWAQCTFASHKSKLALEMIDDELKNYEKLSTDIDKNIVNAKQELETSKLDLLAAKNIRKNREEYDSLAKVIMLQPDRKETVKELENLRRGMEELQQESKQLDRKIQKRQKSFRLLMTSLRQLELLADDADSGEDDYDAEECAVMDVDDVFVVDSNGDELELQPVSPPPLG